jgi:hypothetical protein
VLFAGLFAGALAAGPPHIDPGSDAWVFTSNFPPFSLEPASVHRGVPNLRSGYFSENPEDVSAGARYRDSSRHMVVGAGVDSYADTAFLDHLIEEVFRDSTTARLHAGNSFLSISGNAVFLYCGGAPNCDEREYMWRSGDRIVVRVEAKAFNADLSQAPCPEPTEILQAYLRRYPSALSLYTEDDDHAKKWRREQTALELASAEYWLEQAATAVGTRQSGALESVRNHLSSFAELRRVAFGGPSLRHEAERIGKAELLPAATQLSELKKIQEQYRQWWNAHQNDPVVLPPKELRRRDRGLR